jgi:hypothetical protein
VRLEEDDAVSLLILISSSNVKLSHQCQLF